MMYLLIFLLLYILIGIIYSYIKINVSKFEIKNDKIDKNIKILLITDVHNRKLNNKLEKLINESNPDIIILGGDMINSYEDGYDNFLSMTNILNKYKTYYIYGNHEEASSNIKDYEKMINKSKLILLNNKSTKITNNIVLYGLNIDKSFYENNRKKKLSKNYLENKLGPIDDTKFNILVAHDPLFNDVYSNYNFDLSLSGHIHGGIVKLPFLRGMFSPNYTFFPKYYKGMYKIKNMISIVSSGYGFSRFIIPRVYNPTEIVLISLMKNE